MSFDTDYLISCALAFIMLGIGMSLQWRDIQACYQQPKAFALGLFYQIFFIPFLSLVLAQYSDLKEEWKVGFMILAICPGGTTASFLAYVFRGNTTLSIALITVNSILALFTIPLLVNFSLRFFMSQEVEITLPFWKTVLEIFYITLIPAGAGILIHHFFPRFSQKMQKILKWLSIVLLAIVFTVKIFGKGSAALYGYEVVTLLPITVLLNFIGMGIGYLTSRFAAISIKDGFTIGLELSIHNTSLAFLVGSKLLQNDIFIKPALVYSIFSFWTAIAFGLLVMRSGKGLFENLDS